MRNVEFTYRYAEHNDPTHNSEPARHLKQHKSQSAPTKG